MLFQNIYSVGQFFGGVVVGLVGSKLTLPPFLPRPTEVEDALYSHPAVMEAAVIGLPERILGEEVGAVIQLKPGQHASPKELIDHCRKKIAPFKVPIYIQLRDEPLPKNPNGKVS